MTKRSFIPSPTEWVDIKESPPPKDQWLLLRVRELPQLGTSVMVAIGYYSERTKVFIGERSGECISEICDVEAYHVITDDKGNSFHCAEPAEDSNE